MAQPPETPYTESRRMKIVVGVLVPILSVILGAVGSYIFNQYVNRVRVLDVSVRPSDRLFSRAELPEQGAKVSASGNDVFSCLDITIFNDTDQDFEDVPAKLYFLNAKGEHVRPVLIELRTAPALFSQNITPSTVPAKFDGIPLTLKVVNRRKSVFSGDYYFEGPQPPTAYAEVFKKGLDIEVDGRLGGASIEYLISPWLVMACTAVLTFVVGMVFVQLRPLLRRHR